MPSPVLFGITVNAALRRLGCTSEEMTGHGFRSLASTCLNEQGSHPDLIELRFAHGERNRVRAEYNKAQRLPERRKRSKTPKSLALVSTFVPPSASMISLAMGIAVGVVLPPG